MTESLRTYVSPVSQTPRERLLYWVDAVTRPVHDHGPANDEHVRIEARDLYNLHQALEAYLEKDVDHALIRRLESRIQTQRHDLTVVQGGNRDKNVRVRSWYEGREALLKEQLRSAQLEAQRLRDALNARGE